MFSYGRLRSVFAFTFPLLLALLYMLIGFYVVQHQQEQQIDNNRQQWLDQAALMVSRVKSEYSTVLQLEKTLSTLLEKISMVRSSPEDLINNHLSSNLKELLPDEILANCLIWAFNNEAKGVTLSTASGFMTTKKKAMEKAFTALLTISDPQADESDKRGCEKFLAGVFSDNSAPLYLATQRQGKLTPLQFEGKPYYLYWNKLNSRDKCFGGFMILLPGSYVEDDRKSLQRLAEKVYRESSGNPGIAFFCSSHVDRQFKPVFQAANLTDLRENNRLIHLLRQAWAQGSSFSLRQLHEIDGTWFYIDSISNDTPYSVFVSGSTGKSAKNKVYTPLPAMVVLTFLWGVFFTFRIRGCGLSLGIAFRMLFFMTGMLPVLIFAVLGYNLLKQSAEVGIQAKIKAGYDRLSLIDRKSEDIVPLTGMVIKNILAKLDFQQGFVAENQKTCQQTFTRFADNLKAHKLNLNYLLRIRPGQESEYYVTAPAYTANARYHLDYYAGACNSLHRLLNKHNPAAIQIKLSSSQKTMLNAYGDHEEESVRRVFLHSLERVTTFQSGNMAKHIIFSTILTSKNQIACYLIFGMSLSETLLDLIKDELQYMKDRNDMYYCFSRDLSSDLRIYPQNSRFMAGQRGKQFRNFLESAASSLFRMELRQKDEILIYEPLNKVKLYYAGGVIDISDINRKNELELVFLLLVVAALSGTIYLLAATVSSVMIQPTRKLTEVFREISTGNYSQEFIYPFNNELGQLAGATSRMIRGLKERQLLGKFVSTTFATGGMINTRQTSAQEIQGVVLFSDIRSFTTISESHPPEEIAAMLNNHLRNMVEIIHQHSGQVEQFIGDAVVAFFPEIGNNSCQRAIFAAVAMMQRHHEIQQERQVARQVTYGIGIGVDYGPVMAGILASGSRSEFSVIGTTRTNAEKCEAASKHGRFTKIIVTRQFAMEIVDWQNIFEEHEKEYFELRQLDLPI